MLKHQQKVKSVAVVISPLILSLGVVLLLYLLLGKTLSPFFSAVNLLLFEKEAQVSEGYENIFQGYQERGENGLVVDGNDIVFPPRGALYAKLKIDRIALETDIYYDDSDEALSRGGVGQYYGSRIPGYGSPILICGHNNGKFNALQHVQVGDVVTVTTNYGIYEYKVRELAIKKASDESAINLQKEEEELILYTCYPFYMLGLTNDRYFVYADKISGPEVLH